MQGCQPEPTGWLQVLRVNQTRQVPSPGAPARAAAPMWASAPTAAPPATPWGSCNVSSLSPPLAVVPGIISRLGCTAGA